MRWFGWFRRKPKLPDVTVRITAIDRWVTSEKDLKRAAQGLERMGEALRNLGLDRETVEGLQRLDQDMAVYEREKALRDLRCQYEAEHPEIAEMSTTWERFTQACVETKRQREAEARREWEEEHTRRGR